MANTRVGVIRRGVRDGRDVHRLECAGCHQWVELDLDQWRGQAPVRHTSRWCGGYIATHNFAAIVAAAGGFRAI